MIKVTINIDIEKLRCALCKKYLRNPPVFIQHTGDSVCEKCNTAACKPSFRNKLFEEMMKGVLFPCINAPKGCTARVGFNSTHSHESVCPFKGDKCPIAGCKWLGRVTDLYQHFSTDFHGASSIIMGQRLLFHKNDAAFLLFKLKNRCFAMWVDARKQKICIEVINLHEGNSVEYCLSLYIPNAKDRGEIRKKAFTRKVYANKGMTIEYDKKVVTDMLGRSEMLECSVSLLGHTI